MARPHCRSSPSSLAACVFPSSPALFLVQFFPPHPSAHLSLFLPAPFLFSPSLTIPSLTSSLGVLPSALLIPPTPPIFLSPLPSPPSPILPLSSSFPFPSSPSLRVPLLCLPSLICPSSSPCSFPSLALPPPSPRPLYMLFPSISQKPRPLAGVPRSPLRDGDARSGLGFRSFRLRSAGRWRRSGFWEV